jgi:hypothetical protein
VQLTQEQAAALAAHKVNQIRDTLKEIIELADEYEIRVDVMREFNDHLTYFGRKWIEDDCVGGTEYHRSDDGGWYHSTC